MKFLDYTVKTVDDKQYDFNKYSNQVFLIVNTASEWGFNSQLGQLQDLYEKYKDKGLMVFGFPCNQFYNLEPRDGIDILENYKEKFNVNFPVSIKIDVNGDNSDPLYMFLKKNSLDEKLGSLKDKAVYYDLLKENHPQFLKDKELRWNYTKFLVVNRGEIIERFEPSISPKNISHRIKKHLGT